MIEVLNREPRFKDKMIDNIRKEYSHAMLDLFENLLDEKEIDIPSDDREGDESEARLYGSEYYDMESKVNNLLEKFTIDILGVFGFHIKSDLSKDEIIALAEQELGFKAITESLLNLMSVGSILNSPGFGIVIRETEDKYSIKYSRSCNSNDGTKELLLKNNNPDN